LELTLKEENWKYKLASEIIQWNGWLWLQMQNLHRAMLGPPIETNVFQYLKAIALSTWALEIENFQLQRIIEDLAKFLNKVACAIDGSDQFFTMNICKEHDSC
jgi:hypothetical protein